MQRCGGLALMGLVLALTATPVHAADTLQWQTNRVSADIKSGDLYQLLEQDRRDYRLAHLRRAGPVA